MAFIMTTLFYPPVAQSPNKNKMASPVRFFELKTMRLPLHVCFEKIRQYLPVGALVKDWVIEGLFPKTETIYSGSETSTYLQLSTLLTACLMALGILGTDLWLEQRKNGLESAYSVSGSWHSTGRSQYPLVWLRLWCTPVEMIFHWRLSQDPF